MLQIKRPFAATAPGAASLSIALLDCSANPERVRITNNGGAQNMTNWTILSVIGSQVFTFPTNFTLAPGANVDIVSYSNAVNNPPAELLWSTIAIWNNAGDEARLRAPSGDTVSSRCCSAGCLTASFPRHCLRLGKIRQYATEAQSWSPSCAQRCLRNFDLRPRL